MRSKQEILDASITECPACGETGDNAAIYLASQGVCTNDECPVGGWDPEHDLHKRES